MTIIDSIRDGFKMNSNKRERETEEEVKAVKKQCVGREKPEFQGSVTVGCVDGKSEVTDSFSTYPLRIVQQDPWNAHVSLSVLGFGGGLVNHDCVAMNLNIDEKAVASLKTVGSKKIYRSNEGKQCSQEIYGHVKKDGLLVLTPDPVICYEGGNYKATQEYTVQENASLVLVDWFSAGRQNKDELWQYQSFENHVRVYSEEDHRCLFEQDQTIVNDMDNKVNVFNQPATESVKICGNIVLLGPKTSAIRSSLKDFQTRQAFLERCGQKQIPFNVTTVSEDLSVVRFTAPSQQFGYELLVELLRPLGRELNGTIPYAENIHYDQNHLSFSLNDANNINQTVSTVQDARNALLV